MPLLLHAGRPPAPHDLWGAWNLEPTLVLGLGLLALVYWRGRARGGASEDNRWRRRAFAVAFAGVVLALVSPLDALSGALASAHMVQHVLLLLVAAPLFALSAPGGALLRGSPPSLRRTTARWRRRLRLTRRNLRVTRHPVVVWLVHVATLWLWHASVPYGAALEHEALHIFEHATFLGTGVLFWRVVVGSVASGRVSHGAGLLLVFTMALQSAFLSALLTFAPEPWYEQYATTTAAWGLDHLADQQLAGAIMWVPAGIIYVAVGLSLLVTWLRAVEDDQLRFERSALAGPS